MKNITSKNNILSTLFIYGTTHAVIDAASAGVLFSIFAKGLATYGLFWELVVLYNVLAFGLQAPFGMLIDRLQKPRFAAILGCGLVGMAMMTFVWFPMASVLLVGIGNALFHVGGGSVTLNLTYEKATAPGIFVAPGAIGLLVGILLGKAGSFVAWPFILFLIFLCGMMANTKVPAMRYEKQSLKRKWNHFELMLALILLSIMVRSLVGMAVVFPWKSNMALLVALTIAVALGKAFGGVLADRFGWVRVAVGSLVLSIPLVTLGAAIPALAISGMFLFNFTMPITLVAISNMFPGRPGFAFGLTCLALIMGAVPVFVGWQTLFQPPVVMGMIMLVSVLAIFSGLQLLFNNNLFSYTKEVSSK